MEGATTPAGYHHHHHHHHHHHITSHLFAQVKQNVPFLKDNNVVNNLSRTARLNKKHADKTEVLWCATGRRQHQLHTSAVLIAGVPITQRCLSVIWAFTSTLICRCGYMFSERYRADSLRCVNSARSVGACQRPRFRCWSLVHSRLDYGNSVLVGIPAYLLRRLQSVLNAAARLIYH